MQALAALTLALATVSYSAALAGAPPADTPRKLKADPGQEYFLYLPKNHDPKAPAWLLVAVHAANGDGAGALGLSKIADEGGGIVLAPTFKGDFQDPAKGAGSKLKAILKEVQADFRLQPKIVLVGFAEGAAFAHRYALDNAASVLGCAAHSPDKWDDPSPRARSVAFLVTCGLDDKTPNRIAEAQKFAKAAQDRKFEVQTLWLKGVAHTFDARARDKTKDFFYKLTTGMNAWERTKARSCVAKADAALKAGKFGEAYAAAKELLDLKPSDDYVARANAVLQQVADAGKERLAKLDEQAKAQPDAAAAAYEKLREQFLGTPIAAAVAERLDALANRPQDQPKPKVTEKAEAPPEPNPAKMRNDCRAWLALANNFIANNKTPEARALLQKIISTYPDSVFAEQAKAKLEQLGP
ncbi:MAG TPA: dienelactone hydrolase family protein [Planctomycetota bacterium]|nr:dienelactone hydrolase family protein [Planctomycetota bacterium]HRR80153.1 dienelactone hydrolase family protein [Planctomycetota bacterium]HRT94291.1 dienelactone hydrolase family protein [Planctomycetota bacterium]